MTLQFLEFDIFPGGKTVFPNIPQSQLLIQMVGNTIKGSIPASDLLMETYLYELTTCLTCLLPTVWFEYTFPEQVLLSWCYLTLDLVHSVFKQLHLCVDSLSSLCNKCLSA